MGGTRIAAAWAVWAALAATSAAAAPPVVEAVQYPAWLEREGRTVPLTPGTALQPRDKLRTGSNARVQLKLPEGSAVKLGQNAEFVIERAEDRSVFLGVLRVVTGAFRFTTDSVSKRRRDVTIKVNNVTAGIRGTDLWGKSTDERDLVCLLEGRIAVGAEGHPQTTLDQPLDFYQKPRGQEPSVAKVDPKQVEQWARETEVADDGPAAKVGGRWRVVAAVLPRRDEALRMQREMRSLGYPAEVASRDGRFAVQVRGLAGEAQARALLASLRGIPGVDLPTVHEGG